MDEEIVGCRNEWEFLSVVIAFNCIDYN